MANDAAQMDAVSAPSTEPWTMARLRELGVKLRQVNVLGNGELREPVDIKRLALLVRNADYKPRGFGALVLRFTEPKGSVLLYKSGKFIVLGAKTPDHVKTTVERLTSVLQKVEYPSSVRTFGIANIVNTADLRFPLRLEGLAHTHAKYCQYEPELFPGLVYRMIDPKITILAFVSGKINIIGAKTQEDAERAICKLFPVFLLYRIRYDGDDESFSSSGDDSALDGDDDDDAMREDLDDDDDLLVEL